MFTELVGKFLMKQRSESGYLGNVMLSMKTFFFQKALILIQYDFWSEEERGCYPGLWEIEGAGMGCAAFGRAGTGSW